jgi:predicted transcriptional regulator
MYEIEHEQDIHPLKLILRRRGLSQTWLAKKLGISTPSLCAYLNRHRPPPPEIEEELNAIKETLELRK